MRYCTADGQRQSFSLAIPCNGSGDNSPLSLNDGLLIYIDHQVDPLKLARYKSVVLGNDYEEGPQDLRYWVTVVEVKRN